jgi:hypothetical protein
MNSEVKLGKLTKEDELILWQGKCPVCGSEHFIKGPRGGGAINIVCENGHRFWVGWPFTPEYQGMIHVEREGNTLKAWF